MKRKKKVADGFQIRKDGAPVFEAKALTEENIPYIARESGKTEEELRLLMEHYRLAEPGNIKLVRWQVK